MARPAIDACIVVFMASDAIGHVCQFERRDNFAHCLNFAVTFLARDIFQNMGLVIEIDKIRKHVHFRPPNRLFFIPCFADFLNLGFRRRNKLVASDTSLHGWNHRGFSTARPAVAVTGNSSDNPRHESYG